jgi:hypothetical protein
MSAFLIAVVTGLVSVFGFFSDQLGLSSLGGQRLALFVAEALALTALARWILSAFNVRPAKARAFWVAVPLLALVALLQVHRITNPPRALPHLQAQIDGLVFADIVQDGNARLLVVPEVSIRNTGEASIAGHFDLAVHLPDGRTVHGQPQAIPERLEIPFPDGSALVVFGEDSLERRNTVPIQQGRLARGRLAYVFSPLTSADLSSDGVFCQLTMLDGWDRPCATQMTATGPAVTSAGDLTGASGLRSETRARKTEAPAPLAPKQR